MIFATETTMYRLEPCLSVCLMLTACSGSEADPSTQTPQIDLSETGTGGPSVTEPTPTSTTSIWPDIMTTTDETTDPTSDGATGEGTESGFCSDGVKSEDEACDDGNAGNSIYNEATPSVT
jgi:hypothetical protein